MAVSEVASGQGKGKSRKSRIKRCKKLGLTASSGLSAPKPNSSLFYSSNPPLAQAIHAQAASKLIAFTDIVWLVEQTITVPDDKTGGGGTTQVKALVPQLYVKVQSGDLDGTGTLIAGKDVNNIGGQLDAASSLRASAGRDLNVTTTTSATNINGTNTNSLTRIDRVAGLYVTGQGTGVGANGGMLVATAGRDINLLLRP